MTNYLPIIYFLSGLIVGALMIVAGFLIGFKASYEIRNQSDAPAESRGLFRKESEAAELDLIDEQDKIDEDE